MNHSFEYKQHGLKCKDNVSMVLDWYRSDVTKSPHRYTQWNQE